MGIIEDRIVFKIRNLLIRLSVWMGSNPSLANFLAVKANDLTTLNPGAGVKPGDVLKRHKRHKRRNYAPINEKGLPALLREMDSYGG